MCEKVFSTSKPSGFDMVKAARALGLPTPGNVMVLDGEPDICALSDFFLAEFRVERRTLADACNPADVGLSPRETDVLEAFRRSHTSLFQVVGTRPAEDQVVLRDILEPERPDVFLTDIHLCASLQRVGGPMLLFLRVLEVAAVFMGSGVFFCFDAAHHERLVQSFRHKMRKVAQEEWNERKFAFFYEKHRQFGKEGAYATVSTT